MVDYNDLVKFPFNEAKAAEAAATILRLGGGRMNSVKLIKLLYLVDRNSLLRLERLVTTDRFVLTDKGPSLSQIDDLITIGSIVPGQWDAAISPLQGGHQVELLREPQREEMSDAEIELAEAVYSNFGNKDQWQLIEYSCTLPEWTNPDGTKIALEYADVLKAGGRTQAEIAAIMSELDSLAAVIIATEPYTSGARLLP